MNVRDKFRGSALVDVLDNEGEEMREDMYDESLIAAASLCAPSARMIC